MKILICLLFKNSILWLDRFLNCLDSLIENRSKDVEYNINVIYGDSRDSTDVEVKKRMDGLREKYARDGLKIKMCHLPLPRRLDGLEKLSILRNASIMMSDLENEKYDYVLQMDTDVIFDSESIETLIRDISDNNGKDKSMNDIGVIAPLIYIEGSNTFYDTFAFRMNEKMFKSDIRTNLLLSKFGGIFDVDSVGTIYICRSDIFWKWDIKYGTELRRKDENTKVHPQRKYESEQVVFCNRVREITKYKICVDPEIIVYHINLEKYGKNWH